jgi:hypothetical protein
MRQFAGLLIGLGLVCVSAPAVAVQPVFDPSGSSFYDMPWPFELRRDADGTVALGSFPIGANPILLSYAAALETVPGFGLNSGVFIKFDGDLDPTSLPADAAASRAPGAAVFLINIDKKSKQRGTRTPLWMEYRSGGDIYRDPRMLAAMPVAGHPLEPNTLYALVVTDAVHGADLLPLTPPPLITRMRDEAPQDAFETAALPLFRALWTQLEEVEGLSRDDVVAAAIYRTYAPTDGLVATEKAIHKYARTHGASNLMLVSSEINYWLFTGDVVAPQFQDGTPPFSATTGKFVFDAAGRPVVQREETLQFVLSVPKDRADASLRMPSAGWPVVHYMHGTGGNRFSFVSEGLAAAMADQGIAMIGIDQPLHGLRAGATPDGSNFYNPLNPYALRDNPRQAAADSLTIHELVARLRIDQALITGSPGVGYVFPAKKVALQKRARMFMGHSQGATTGPLFLGVAKKIRGGVLSAGGGHIILNVLTREEPFFGGLKLRDLVELLVGVPVDLFHPILHLLQMGTEVSEPVLYARLWGPTHKGGPLNVLCTHGMLDGYVTSPMTFSMVAAARYPLIAPTFAPMSFAKLPGYDYQEAFDLAGLATLSTPVSGNIGSGRHTATGGILLFDGEGHFPVFYNSTAQAQYREFLRALAYDTAARIPSP